MADNPITRKEKYLAKLTGSYAGNVPDPITRVEKYLYDLCQKGVSGLTPEEIENAVNKYLKENPVQPGATTEQAQQIEQNKTDIASLKKETGSLKGDISTKIAKFYASSQGETHLADSDNGKIMDMMLYGRSEQKQYSGKNLLNVTLQTTTMNGVTFTTVFQNKMLQYINIDGTATNLAYVLVDINLKANTKYILSGWYEGAGNTFSGALRNINLTSQYAACLNTPTVFTVPDDGTYRLMIRVENNATISDKKIYPMIRLASVDDDAYEPYTGGIPSPNPDYPQEIKSVVNPAIKICGKNLLELPISNKSTQAGITFEVINDSVIKITGINDGSRVSQYIAYNSQDVKHAKLIPYKNIAITISTYNDDVIAGLAYWLKSENYATVHYKQNKRKCTIDLGEDAKIVPWFFIPQNGTYTNNTVKFGVYYGTDELTYDSPKCHTVTLPYTLNAIPVNSGGNVTIDGQQYIADYVDVERGKVVKRVKVLNISNLDKSKWGFRTDTSGVIWHSTRYYGTSSMLDFDTNINAMSNIAIYGGIGHDAQGTFRLVDAKTYLYQFNLDKTKFDKVQDFTDYLVSNNVYIQYALKVPQELDLKPEEIVLFKSLSANYPTTNISINSEQLDGYTVFNYPISMQNGWNYVKQQIGDTREYIYDMDARAQDTDLQAAEAYVNSEYAVALTELEV